MTHPPLAPRVPALAGRGRSLVTTLAVALSLLLLIVAGCTASTEPPTQTVTERLKESPIWGKDQIRIGVYEDTPLMGYREPDGQRRRTGFEIGLARGIARFLGYKEEKQIEWVPLTAPSQREYVLFRGEADLVVASWSIDTERKDGIRFAGPYLITKQKFLVSTARAGEVTEISHLKNSGLPVCVVGATTTQNPLRDENIEIDSRSRRADCVTGVLDGTYIAMSSDETILTGLQSQQPSELTLVDLPLDARAERLGVGIPPGDEALRDVVGHYLMRNYRQEQEGRSTDWQDAYNENLRDWLGSAKQPRPTDAPPLRDHDDRGPR